MEQSLVNFSPTLTRPDCTPPSPTDRITDLVEAKRILERDKGGLSRIATDLSNSGMWRDAEGLRETVETMQVQLDRIEQEINELQSALPIEEPEFVREEAIAEATLQAFPPAYVPVPLSQRLPRYNEIQETLVARAATGWPVSTGEAHLYGVTPDLIAAYQARQIATAAGRVA